MIDKRIEELMWLEIDEAISTDDHERLWSHLNGHPEDRAHFEHLKALSALFSGVGEIDPPPELRPRIRRSLQMASPEWIDTVTRPSLWTRFRDAAMPRPALRVVGAALAGLFIGIIGYHVVSYQSGQRQPLDTSQVSGTMGLRSVDETGPVVDIDLSAVSGTFAVERDGSRVRTRLDVTSETEIDVVIAYEGPAVEYGGGDLTERSTNQITVENHGIRVRNRGEGLYYFVFQLPDNPMSPMKVNVLAEEELLLEELVYPEQSSKKE
ncbi:MAG: hypothetical protein JSW50_14860 [Candidatus Latescibacterota bacterium]|nr:MAG: hypothetical protein JSW50_14860 [Candidatus Latescibacterota bacterium]